MPIKAPALIDVGINSQYQLSYVEPRLQVAAFLDLYASTKVFECSETEQKAMSGRKAQVFFSSHRTSRSLYLCLSFLLIEPEEYGRNGSVSENS